MPNALRVVDRIQDMADYGGVPSDNDHMAFDTATGKWGPVAPATGTGDVTGPSGATDGNLAVFDGTDGKTLRDGGAVPSPAAGKLGYTAITTAFTSSSNTFVDVTNLNVSVTIGSRPVRITVYSPMLDSADVGARCSANIYDVTASAQIQASWVTMGAGTNGSALCMVAYHAPAAGSRTYKVQFKQDKVGGGAGRFYAASDSPAFILVEEI